MAEPRYTTQSYVLRNRGLVARYVQDQFPADSWACLDNLESLLENALSARFGPSVINQNGVSNAPLTGGAVHTLGRLKGLSGATYRYAGCGTNLYRRSGDTAGAYTNISALLSGNRFSSGVYRPDASSSPYLFIADSGVMLKDSGTLNPAQNWGGFPPASVPAISLQAPSTVLINAFNVAIGNYTAVNFGTNSNPNRVNTTCNQNINGGQINTVTPASMAGIEQGMLLAIGGAAETVYVVAINTNNVGVAVSFTAFFVSGHVAADTITSVVLQGTVAVNTTGSVAKSSAVNLGTVNSQTVDPDDVIMLWVNISDPSHLTELRIFMDVGDGSFTQDYYLKSIAPSSFQAVVSGIFTGAIGAPGRVNDVAGGRADPRRIGTIIDDPVGGNDDSQRRLRPFDLLSGLSRWTLIQIPIGEFIKVGKADTPGHSWANVNAYKVQIQTNTVGSVVAQLGSFFLLGGNGPDSFAGEPYDYRYTFYNANTGYETSPSQQMLPSLFVSPRRQPISVTISGATDPQFTHSRIYRRGGTLTVGWFRVAQLPVSQLAYSDGIPDSIVELNPLLEIDNDPPVTALLPNPVNTTLQIAVAAGVQVATPVSMANIFPNQLITIGSGLTQEVVYVQAVTGTTFTASFQVAHNIGEVLLASARLGQTMNLCAFAFDRAWLAGDPNNPHLLYYSKVQRPESVPPENFIEIGTPKDPIMAVVELRGLLFVLTLNRIYEVIGAGTAIPIALPTAAKHGLFANFAWCADESAIYYRSYDGIYVFRGGKSDYISEPVELVWTGNLMVSGNILGGSTTTSVIMAPLALLAFPIGSVVSASSSPGFVTVVVNTTPTSVLVDPPLPIAAAGKLVLANSPMSADPAQVASTVMTFGQREVWIAYTGHDGNRHRLAYHTVYQRFRSDTLVAHSVFFEEDTGNLLFGDGAGLVYRDRVNSYDSGGFAGGVEIKNPISINLQTPALEQRLANTLRSKKQYQNLSLDIDTNGQALTVILLFDRGQTPLNLGTVSAAGRTQIQLPINSGLGYTSYDVALKVIGQSTLGVTIYEFHIDALVEAELRKIVDTYFLKFGTDEFNTMKNIYFEYTASDAAGISFSAYLDGNSTVEYTFTLPQALTRTAVRIRVPARKFKMYRLIGTSPSDFQVYEDSMFEVKQLTSDKGYIKERLLVQ